VDPTNLSEFWLLASYFWLLTSASWLLASGFCLLSSDFCFENSRPYERTQHLIENKAQEFSEPSISLKINSLTKETQHSFDNKILSLEFAG